MLNMFKKLGGIIMKKRFRVGGVHTFTHYEPKNSSDQILLDILGEYFALGQGHKFVDQCKHLISHVRVEKNITVSSGHNHVAKVLCGTFTGTNPHVTHFAIGDDNTAAAAGDTTLGNEVFRKAVSSAADDSNTANISTFIAASEANFTWEEWGHFVDATGTADDGIMMSHHIEQQVKASPNTVTIDSVYTITDA